MLDFELPAQVAREEEYDVQSIGSDLVSDRPIYLMDDDRVLFLDNDGNDQYWLIEQGVFWSEPYAEAYALRSHGDDFIEDRYFFYRLLDRQPVESLSSWLKKKRVTLLVDRGTDADAYLGELNQRQGLGMRHLDAGVWRLPSSGD